MTSPSLLERIAPGLDAELRENFALAPWTSVRVGGSAELFAKPRTPDALVELLKRARNEGAPVSILGGGANTLIGDGGVEGVVLKLPSDLAREQVDLDSWGGRLTLPAGAAIARLVQQMKAHGLVDAEFLAGVPGTLGGAVAMNAGTKMGECMSVVEAVELATPDGLGWVDRAALAVEYRHTGLPAGAVVTRARFALPAGDLTQSQAKMDADLGYRKRTQPLSQPNFGSVFQNPPGDHAGRLIEQTGLKGHVIGRAQISAVHANWIVNLGGASARDVVALMDLAQARVQDSFGVALRPEVRRMGRFT